MDLKIDTLQHGFQLVLDKICNGNLIQSNDIFKWKLYLECSFE